MSGSDDLPIFDETWKNKIGEHVFSLIFFLDFSRMSTVISHLGSNEFFKKTPLPD